MGPTQLALLTAMTDALGGKGVLFLTPDRTSTEEIVGRALRVATDQILLKLPGVTLEEAERLFKYGTSPWHILVSDGGWAFFFPVNELQPDEDVNNPDYVYCPDGDQAYVRVDYPEWKRKQQPSRAQVPRTAWDRLNDD